MPRLTLAQAEDRYYLFRLISILVSGENPDGSPYALPIENLKPVAANILNGRVSSSATTGATTLITVPAGRTWVGEVGASVACSVAGGVATAGRASAEISIAGAGSTPSAGIIFGVHALTGPNVTTGMAGNGSSNSNNLPLTVVAPSGNSVTVQVASTITGTAGLVDAFASGRLI